MAKNQAVICDTKPFIGDMLIAATALHHDIEIFTLNRKDFHFIPNLKLYTINT